MIFALTGYIPVKIGKVFPSRRVTNRLRLHKYSPGLVSVTKPAGDYRTIKASPQIGMDGPGSLTKE
jgi:hypothetical protein